MNAGKRRGGSGDHRSVLVRWLEGVRAGEIRGGPL